jgi:hypothetical protein
MVCRLFSGGLRKLCTNAGVQHGTQADQPNRCDFRRLDVLNRLSGLSMTFGWLA